MLFNSLTFLALFIVALGVQRTRLPWTGKKVFLLAASWFFYSAARPELLLLLIASTIGNWLIGNAVASARSTRGSRAWVTVAVILNIGILSTFKYGRFLTQNVVAIAGVFGIEWVPPDVALPLPIGVSFYTFQALSYVVDVHRKQVTPSKSLLDFSLYAAFFRTSSLGLSCAPPCSSRSLSTNEDRPPLSLRTVHSSSCSVCFKRSSSQTRCSAPSRTPYSRRVFSRT